MEKTEPTTAIPPVASFTDSNFAHKPPFSAIMLSCHDPGVLSVQAKTMPDGAKEKCNQQSDHEAIHCNMNSVFLHLLVSGRVFLAHPLHNKPHQGQESLPQFSAYKHGLHHGMVFLP
jgi:hypothetical protein